MNIHLQIVDADTAPMRQVTFRSGAYRLRGHLSVPRDTPRAAVVLCGATGVAASYYHAFANWLANKQGVACLTFDYRDFGASAKTHPRRSRATMADWAIYDAEAARSFLRTQFPTTPQWVIGHSLGALAVAFQRDLDKIDRLITVASGPVHTSDHPWPYQGLARLFWHGHAPLVTRAAGYMPGRRLGLGADLPSGVYWQWRRWCTRRDFFAREFGEAMPYPDWMGLKAPVKVVAVADDVMVPPAAVWRLMQFYPNAPKRQLTLRPGDFGLSEIGHIGVFAARNSALWPALIA